MSHAGCPECADADSVKRVSAAAGEGSMAVSEIHRYLSQPTIPATEGIK